MANSKIPTKAAFLKQYAMSRAELHAFINSLSEYEFATPTDAAGWTIKDHLAHLAAWQIGIAALLQGKPRWQAMGLSDAFVARAKDFDPINDAMRRKHARLSMREALDFLSNADAQFLFALSNIGASDFAKPYSAFSGEAPTERNSQPIYGWIHGDSDHHFNDHLTWMRQILLDDLQRAIARYGDGPRLLASAIKKAPRKMWTWKPSKREWSVHEILVHLADSETNSYLRVRKGVAEPDQPIMAYDQDQWATALDYHKRDAVASVALTKMVRDQTHAFIKTLDDAVWRRRYFHPESKRHVPLTEWLRGYADHIPEHVAQIERVVAQWRKRAG